jgi:hypothetical protein
VGLHQLKEAKMFDAIINWLQMQLLKRKARKRIRAAIANAEMGGEIDGAC